MAKICQTWPTNSSELEKKPPFANMQPTSPKRAQCIPIGPAPSKTTSRGSTRVRGFRLRRLEDWRQIQPRTSVSKFWCNLEGILEIWRNWKFGIWKSNFGNLEFAQLKIWNPSLAYRERPLYVLFELRHLGMSKDNNATLKGSFSAVHIWIKDQGSMIKQRTAFRKCCTAIMHSFSILFFFVVGVLDINGLAVNTEGGRASEAFRGRLPGWYCLDL